MELCPLLNITMYTFYENLYASHEIDSIIHCNIDNINTPTLSQEESDSLEGPINLQEALSSNLLLLSKMTKVLVLMALQLSF